MNRGFDAAVIVIGAGIAGASAASALAEDREVILLEQAASPGYHATGRSASLLSETSGHRVVRALASASRAFFESPPRGFVDHPLLSPRGLLWVGEQADARRLDQLAELGRLAVPSVRRVSSAEVIDRLPHFRQHAVAGGGTFEPDAMAIDTDSLLQGFLRSFRQRGGRLVTSCPATRLKHDGRAWQVHAGATIIRAPIVVNAAGAWGDLVAAQARVRPVGLEPRRRTACSVPLADVDHTWPMVMDVASRYYLEPESGGLLISPADETISEPCDASPDEIDVAIALDRVRDATTLPVRSVRRAWAGLRTFSPDGAPVIGEEPGAPGFWWLVGQGGGGIKTAPAAARALSALVRGEALPAELAGLGIHAEDLSPTRFHCNA